MNATRRLSLPRQLPSAPLCIPVLRWCLAFVMAASCVTTGTAADPPAVPGVRIVPTADRGFSFEVAGVQRLAWHFPKSAPRPFLYPVIGPSGQSVTRMGHPGAPDHDHHRSIWFAHYKVDGHDFWSENGGTRIEQIQWYALEDGPSDARVAVLLRWFTPTDEPIVDQDVVVSLQALPNGESAIEIQTTLRPTSDAPVTFEQTNYGLLAVRVSKAISGVFGGGVLTSDNGETGEPKLFEKSHRWVDYSGDSPVYESGKPGRFTEGITYFDHPQNPGFPNAWHVRADGWMCASPTMRAPIEVTPEQPLRLRYLLHVHAGPYDTSRAESLFGDFAKQSAWSIRRATQPHVRYQITREATAND